jgi:hypothetical protein
MIGRRVRYGQDEKQLGPLRGGTIEFALCAVEGKTEKVNTSRHYESRSKFHSFSNLYW